MTTMSLPACNFGIFAGYAEQVPEIRKFGNGTKCANFTVLIPREKGSFHIYVTGSLAEEIAANVKPEDMVICYGRTTTLKSTGKICLQAIRVENYGKYIDLQYMQPLDIIKNYTINVPEAGYHRIRG